jgi:hypothetical protein
VARHSIGQSSGLRQTIQTGPVYAGERRSAEPWSMSVDFGTKVCPADPSHHDFSSQKSTTTTFSRENMGHVENSPTRRAPVSAIGEEMAAEFGQGTQANLAGLVGRDAEGAQQVFSDLVGGCGVVAIWLGVQ